MPTGQVFSHAPSLNCFGTKSADRRWRATWVVALPEDAKRAHDDKPGARRAGVTFASCDGGLESLRRCCGALGFSEPRRTQRRRALNCDEALAIRPGGNAAVARSRPPGFPQRQEAAHHLRTTSLGTSTLYTRTHTHTYARASAFYAARLQ
ncbi:hypothetical protein HPB50_024026 [Hyalomma asiaticum]|uniref:Uncharacterized protein n=1 Tax=Hyalomma asiaticum TaxID=266040 RepID=A0ACB7T205_HYAAI|nr:hypothetical protein HPB50_024026 [Hyalomma asiaticum]